MTQDLNKRILVVNDLADQREVAGITLELAGYEVLFAASGNEGYRTASSEMPDLILSDVMMPDGSGIDLCRLVRADERLAMTPILLVSAIRRDSRSAIEGLEAGADDYIEIPFEPVHLLAKVSRLLERKLLEDKLKASEELFRGVFENAAIAIALVNAEGKFVRGNPVCFEMIGYTPDELAGRSFIELTHPDDREKDWQLFRDVIEGRRQSYQIEKRYIRRDGSLLWGHLSVSKVSGVGGDVEFAIGMIEDVTDRKRMEDALRESEEHHRIIAETAQDAIIGMDEASTVLFVNKAAEAIFGYSSFEVIGRPITDLMPERFRAFHLAGVANYMRTGERRVPWGQLEVLGLHRDGREIPLELSFGVTRSGGRQVFIGVARDVSRRRADEEAIKQKDEQLRQSQKLESVGRLAGGIAHDFNNMLTAINGYSEIILRQLPAGDPLRPKVEEIKKAGERSASLTHQLLAFSRRQVLQPARLDLNDVVRDTSTMLQRLLGEDLELKIVLDPNLGPVEADIGQLTQVIMNLAVNARDAMPDGGSVTIETANIYLDQASAVSVVLAAPGPYVMLAVTDTGTGISPDDRPHIFEPFYTTKEMGRGTGLGLATVYGIVKQSGGYIWVESEPGAGSTFRIYLPRIEEEAAAAEADPAAKIPSGTETILIVEDEPLVRSLTRQVLEECGYNVVEAANGIEALEICQSRRHDIDLLITDVVMPDLGGRELAAEVSLLDPELPILFTSGYTDDDIVRRGIIEVGANFIQKPFNLELLAHKVRELLNG